MKTIKIRKIRRGNPAVFLYQKFVIIAWNKYFLYDNLEIYKTEYIRHLREEFHEKKRQRNYR